MIMRSRSGIGEIPDAVLRNLHDHRGLGIHSEMLSDGIIDLIETGAITNGAHACACKIEIELIDRDRYHDFYTINLFIDQIMIIYIYACAHA
jgi:4-hydroxybutyrate CoA-transferase